eukprot:TRINITY_DN55148_c0_g1_i1.p1 TRINITY_DN55148_c0_g1~~TRINITY_DN55148_c0_g1_i1.p1  ORF type:complete len:534 (+),score=197.08 TRINITY_DN55148_c0_g1_i1:74-1603(+)
MRGSLRHGGALRAALPLLLLSAAGAQGGVIDTIIVFMLENRSFDHMLGFLRKLNAKVDGCLPDRKGCDSPEDPADPKSPRVSVMDGGLYVSESDPDHSISGTTKEIFGKKVGEPWPTGDMSGFVKQYNRGNRTDFGRHIMKCFDPDQVPAIATLAQEFALFDRWFVSVPGPTMPNRAYSMSATSHGTGTNDVTKIVLGWPQKTVFKALDDAKKDWRVYFQEVPSPLAFRDVRTPERLLKFRLLEEFWADAKDGKLPAYSWVDPRYFGLDKDVAPATDQHPNHPVDAGDRLIKKVYEAVRNGPKWNSTLLLITYDEHGGWYDHVTPPNGVPNPDGLNSTDDPFDFTRLGVRVPTIAVSPRIPKGTLINKPGTGGTAAKDGSEFDATSILATLHKMYGTAPLTKRDEWAATFEDIFSLKEPRGDCPTTLPSAPDHNALLAARGKSLPTPETAQLNDLQQMLAEVVAGLPAGNLTQEIPRTEAEAGRWALRRIAEYLKQATGGQSPVRGPSD